METDVKSINKNIIGVITVGIVIVLGISIFYYLSLIGAEEREYEEDLQFLPIISTNLLTPMGNGLVSFQAQVYNDTFLSCDGVNDYIKITPSSNDTLAFWYNSSTSESWQFVVNTLGTQYTNGSLGDAVEYPVYWDGTDYYFCKTDATTFWEGSIDKISIYDGQLSSVNISNLYLEERW
jgi:hypothetical protein